MHEFLWPTVYRLPPWPSASFPSVKALRRLCETKTTTRAFVCGYYVVSRETFLNVCSMIARCLHTCIHIDEKLTPRDLSTDNIVLQCISHRSIAGHYMKSILLYVDIASAGPVALIYLRASINLYRVFECTLSLFLSRHTWWYSLLIYRLKYRGTHENIFRVD